MSELKLYEIDTDYPTSISSGSYYDKDEVDTVLAEKDKEIAELNARLETVNELVKTARKFLDDANNAPCAKKDEEIKKLRNSVKFFSETLHRQEESAKKCFSLLMDEGLLRGWALTKVYSVMPKYTKERLDKFEAQEQEIAKMKARIEELGKDIRHQQYSRCMAMAWLCYTRDCMMLDRAHGTDTYYVDSFYWRRAKWYGKWKHRWLVLADEFKAGA